MDRMRKVALMLMLVGTAAISGTTQAQEIKLDNLQDKISYTLGIQFAIQMVQELERLGMRVDGGILVGAISDIVTRSDLKMTEDEMNATLQSVSQEQERNMKEMADLVKQSGDEFRADYVKQENVQSTDSGLLYRVMTKGDGAQPGQNDTVVVHYRGRLTDGTEFDSSYSRNEPTTFGLGGIIPGWNEALQLMNVGATWEVVIPPQLAYGDRGAPPAIPPAATLIFDIQLLDIQ